MNYHNGTPGPSAQDLLAQSVYYQKKAAARGAVAVFAHILLIIVLSAVLVSGALLAPRVIGLIRHAEGSLSEIDGIMDDVRSVTEDAKTMLENDADGIGEAMNKLNAIDFDKLNEAIRNLSDAAEPLAELSRKLP